MSLSASPKTVTVNSLIGRYRATPVMLPDGEIAYLLIDAQGRVLNLLVARDDNEDPQLLKSDTERNLHITHAHNIKSVSVTSPGVAYVNGTNALCLVAPTSNREVEIVSVRISTKAAGDFYICARNLGNSLGDTTTYTFDLSGIKGDGVTDTCDCIWAMLLTAAGRGATGGEYVFDCGCDCELYLIAPDVDYSLTVSWLIEVP